MVEQGSGRAPTGFDPSRCPMAGDVFAIAYPFVRGKYEEPTNDGLVERATWNPGVEHRWYSPEGTEPYCDAEGRAVFTVIGVYRPGRFPTRVFFTRKYIDPDGGEFGKSRLHIATLDKFRRLCVGYQHPYGIGDGPAPNRGRDLWFRTRAKTEFEKLLAAARDSDGSPEGGGAKQDAVHDSAGPQGHRPATGDTTNQREEAQS